jgi:hypothetical protein
MDMSGWDTAERAADFGLAAMNGHCQDVALNLPRQDLQKIGQEQFGSKITVHQDLQKNLVRPCGC